MACQATEKNTEAAGVNGRHVILNIKAAGVNGRPVILNIEVAGVNGRPVILNIEAAVHAGSLGIFLAYH